MKESQAKKHSVLVLDGDHKNTLAIVRHLGKTKQYEIDVVFSRKMSLCYFSKYVSQKHIISHPKQNPAGYVDDIVKILERKQYLVVIPVSYISYKLCSKGRESILKHSHITITSPENIDIASNKAKTYRLAEELGIPYPQIYNPEQVDIEDLEVSYPCVIKSPLELGNSVIDYAHSREELISKYKKMCADHDFNDNKPIVQKYIVGEGAGLFVYYKNGKCQNYFMHKRIREYPPSGGPSVVAEAYYNEQILKDGTRMLDELQWEGVAMVEFKKDNKTGIYNLMEINAKFWGSLDLALVCGANFPQLLINDALGKEIQKWNYKQKRFQWILNGDLFYLFERPWRFCLFIRDLFVSKNDIWLRDIVPNLFQLIYIPVHYYKKWFK